MRARARIVAGEEYPAWSRAPHVVLRECIPVNKLFPGMILYIYICVYVCMTVCIYIPIIHT